MKRDTVRMLRDLANYSSLGLSVALSIVIGLFIGLYLDKKLGTGPVLMFVFLFMGIAAGFRNIWHQMNRIKKDDDKRDTE